MDKHTKDKTMLQYARLMVEISLDGDFLEYIEFANENNMLIRQAVRYEWLPLKCTHCKMFGHTQDTYKKRDMHKKEWRVKAPTIAHEHIHPIEEEGVEQKTNFR